MKELIKSILILVKAIFDDEKKKNGNRHIDLGNFFTQVFSIKKEDLFLNIGFDWSGRSFDDDRDLYLYRLIVNPNKWDSNQAIRLMYDIEKDRFCCHKIDTNSMASHNYNDETMLKHIHDVIERIAKKRGI